MFVGHGFLELNDSIVRGTLPRMLPGAGGRCGGAHDRESKAQAQGLVFCICLASLVPQGTLLLRMSLFQAYTHSTEPTCPNDVHFSMHPVLKSCLVKSIHTLQSTEVLRLAIEKCI